MKDPQQLIDDYLHNTLEESGQAELRSWLMEDDAHMRHFTEALMFDEEIRAAVQAKEGANSAGRFTGSVTSIPQHPPSASPFRSTPKTAHRLARAAAWLGAFTWFGNKAQAAGAVSTTTTLLMTKTTTTTTTITAAILLAGGGSIYLIHQSNQQATARVELLQARKDAAHEATAGMRTSRPVAASPEAASRKTSAAVLTTKTNTEILQQINRLTGTNPNSGMITEAEALKTKLEALDGQKLKELLVEAEQMNDLHPEVMAYLLYLLSELSSADAVLWGTELLMNATGFNDELAMTVGYAFEAWMKSDPAAADKWYLAAMASGALTPKSLPNAGSEEYLPERFLARRRFSVLLKTDSEQAVAMVTSMAPADAANEVSRSGNSDLIARIAAQLPPKQQYAAAEYQVREIVEKDFKQATDWVNALEIAETTRGNLLAQAASTAYGMGTLSRSEALKIINGLPETPLREQARLEVEGK